MYTKRIITNDIMIRIVYIERFDDLIITSDVLSYAFYVTKDLFSDEILMCD